MSFFPPTGSGSHPCPTATKLAATCPQYTLQPDTTDYEVESDIVDQCFDLIDGEQEEIPQRPLSRLGFHSELPDYYATDTEDPSETTLPKMISGSLNADSDNQDSIDLASSLSLVTYDMGEDITTVASSHCLQGDLPQPLPPRHIGLKIKVPENRGRANTSLLSDDESDFADSESSSDCSYDSSDDYFDFSPTEPTSPPSNSHLYAPSLVAPVARLPSSPSHVSTISPEPPSTASVRMSSHKPSHHNHGYSKHALHHIKSFWIMREGQWADYDTELRDHNTCNGFANLGQPSGSDPIRSHAQRSLFKMKSPVPRGLSLPPMSIHPRRGDIASLRDPFCAHIDRCFVSLPSWTLAKTLYMFDVHVGYEWQNRLSASMWKQCSDGPSCSDALQQKCSSATTDSLDDVDTESESESLGTSASVASSDDSDVTLVESENEGELEREDYSAFEAFMSDAGPSSPSSSTENDQNTPRLKYSSSHFEHVSPKCSISPMLYEQMQSPRAEFFCTLDDDVKSMTPWATNWYRRWEILMELVRFNWGQDQFFAALGVNEQRYHAGQSYSQGNTVDANAERKGKRRLKRQPRFFLADDNTIDDDDTSWEWDLTFDLNSNAKISEPTFGLGHKTEGSIPL
ncbi:hypothetical protein F5887DRAFT_1002200 [Amanita rubescens]|nr:hypothetical protein F5887DRAFT_1002200 [Amanita rubescens]